MKIETEETSWECGDGCCSRYDTILYIDGKAIDQLFSCEREAYEYVLTELLGHEVDFIDHHKEEYGF